MRNIFSTSCPASLAPSAKRSHSLSELPPRRGLDERIKTLFFMPLFHFNDSTDVPRSSPVALRPPPTPHVSDGPRLSGSRAGTPGHRPGSRFSARPPASPFPVTKIECRKRRSGRRITEETTPITDSRPSLSPSRTTAGYTDYGGRYPNYGFPFRSGTPPPEKDYLCLRTYTGIP